MGPDFAGQDGRKTGSWEEGGQQGFSLMSSEEFVEIFIKKKSNWLSFLWLRHNVGWEPTLLGGIGGRQVAGTKVVNRGPQTGAHLFKLLCGQAT